MYNPSTQPRVAVHSSTLVRQRLVSSSSVCIRAQNDSTTALHCATPCRPWPRPRRPVRSPTTWLWPVARTPSFLTPWPGSMRQAGVAESGQQPGRPGSRRCLRQPQCPVRRRASPPGGGRGRGGLSWDRQRENTGHHARRRWRQRGHAASSAAVSSESQCWRSANTDARLDGCESG